MRKPGFTTQNRSVWMRARQYCPPALAKIVLLALALRLLALFYVFNFPPAAMDGDSAEFLALAESLLKRGEFEAEVNSLFPTGSVRTPGYPVFLAAMSLFGASRYALALVVQVLLSSLNVILVFHLTRRVTGGEKAALFASLLLAIDPSTVLYSVTVMSETLFTTGVLLFVFILLAFLHNRRWLQAVALALCMAALVYLRPIAQFLPLLVGLVLALSPHRRNAGMWGKTIVAGGLVFLLLMPLLQRNQKRYGFRGLSAVTAFDVLYYGGGMALARGQEMSWDAAQDTLRARLHERVHPDSVALGDYLAEMQRLGIETMLTYLPEYAWLHVRGMLATLFDPGRVNIARFLYGPGHAREGLLSAVADHGLLPGLVAVLQRDGKVALFFLLGMVWQVVFFALAVAGLWKRIRSRNRRLVVLLAVIIFYFIFLPGPFGAARFRVPVTPLLATLAALAPPVFSAPRVSAETSGKQR